MMTDINIDSLKAEMDALRAENEALKERSNGQITLKVSAKGAVSVYGLQRFPVTLYANQFERLLEAAPQIRDFISDNGSELATR
jgi:hypothetical protein